MPSLELAPWSTPSALTGRRTLTGGLSLGLHALAGLAVLALALLDDGPLPMQAREVHAFLDPVALAAPPPPPPPAAAARAVPRTAQPPVASEALLAPIAIPEDVRPEDGLDVGLEGGVPGGVEGGVPGGVVGGIVGGLPDAPPPPSMRPLLAGRDVQAPRRLRGGAPVYPPAARASRLEGIVILDCVIDERGRVRDARVLRGFPLLEEAALEAVQTWVYAPSLLDGVPVPVQMTVTVAFQLVNP